MREKLFRVFVIFMLICMFFSNVSFGATSNEDDAEEEKTNWIIAFFKHPGETMVTGLAKLFLGFADGVQYTADLVQTIPDGTWSHFNTRFSYNFLSKDGIDGNLNKYTNVTEYNKEKSKDAIEVDNDKEYGKKTKIPVIPVDITTMATGNVDAFNVNFFENKKGKQSFIKGLAKATIRIVIYISSAGLIITLIWHGIRIVIGSRSLDNPEERLSHKKGLEKFAKGLGLLIGSVVIMAMFIYGTEAIYNIFTGGNNDAYEFPIRVKVKRADYSFSTNITGYVRYMASSNNVLHCVKKITYACTYFILSFVNLSLVVIMMFRTLMMWYLSVLGPILALLYVFNRRGPMTYQEWIVQYAMCSSVQIVLSLISVIILNTYSIIQ